MRCGQSAGGARLSHSTDDGRSPNADLARHGGDKVTAYDRGGGSCRRYVRTKVRQSSAQSAGYLRRAKIKTEHVRGSREEGPRFSEAKAPGPSRAISERGQLAALDAGSQGQYQQARKRAQFSCRCATTFWSRPVDETGIFGSVPGPP